jgi:hypothetical protein
VTASGVFPTGKRRKCSLVGSIRVSVPSTALVTQAAPSPKAISDAYVEEIARHDPGGLGVQELAPGRAASPWRGRQPCCAKDAANGGGGHGDADTVELADDTQVAPAGILAREPDDQAEDLGVGLWTADASLPVRPAAPDEGAVAAKQRVGRDDKPDPPFRPQQSGKRRQVRSVGRSQPWSPGGSPKDGELVAQDEQLCRVRDVIRATCATKVTTATNTR